MIYLKRPELSRNCSPGISCQFLCCADHPGQWHSSPAEQGRVAPGFAHVPTLPVTRKFAPGRFE